MMLKFFPMLAYSIFNPSTEFLVPRAKSNHNNTIDDRLGFWLLQGRHFGGCD